MACCGRQQDGLLCAGDYGDTQMAKSDPDECDERSVVLSAGSEQTLRTVAKRDRTASAGQFYSGMRAGYDLQIQSAAVFAASDGCGCEQTSLWRGE